MTFPPQRDWGSRYGAACLKSEDTIMQKMRGHLYVGMEEKMGPGKTQNTHEQRNYNLRDTVYRRRKLAEFNTGGRR